MRLSVGRLAFRLLAAGLLATIGLLSPELGIVPGRTDVALAQALPTRLGPATFDAARQAIVIPYTGAIPRFSLERMAANYHYYDFKSAAKIPTGVQGASPGGQVERFFLANRQGGIVRLSFKTARPSTPAIRVDTAGRRIEVFPLGRAAVAPRLSPAPAPAGRPVIGRPYFDATRSVVVVPFSGPTPDYRVFTLGGADYRVYFDFIGAVPAAGRTSSGRFGDTLFERWVLAPRSQEGPTRLTLHLARPTRLVAQVAAADGQIRVSAPDVRRPAPPRVPVPPRPVPTGVLTPIPLAPSPAPSPVPATPAPAPSPSAPLARPLPLVSPLPTPRPTVRPTAVPAPTPRPSVRRVVATRFSNAYFDDARRALVMPFSGAPPAFYTVQPVPTTVTVDFPRSAISRKGTLVQNFTGHPLLTRWTAVELPAEDVVRVTFTLTQPGEVLVSHDVSRRQLLVFPQLRGDLDADAAGADLVSAVFGRAVFDAKSDALVLPYTGQTPLYAIARVSSNYLYVDFLNAAINPSGVQFERIQQHPLLSFWLLARRPERNVVRLALTLPYGGFARVLDDQANRRLLVMPQLGAPEAAPTPAVVPTPTPSVSPETGAPTAF